MLPLGRLSVGERDSEITPHEQRALMTPCSIARSPLIMSGDRRHLDAPTLALPINPTSSSVNQAGHDDQPHLVADDPRVWLVRPTAGAGTCRALYNTGKAPRDVSVDQAMPGIAGPARVRDLWTRTGTAVAQTRVMQRLPERDAGLYRLAAA